MSKGQWLKLCVLIGLLIGAIAIYQRVQAQQQTEKPPAPATNVKQVELPQHRAAPGDGENMVVQLCDGETNMTVKGVRPGERLSPKQAQVVSDQLMSMWFAKKDPAAVKAWQQEAATAGKKPSRQGSKKSSPTPSSGDKQEEQVNDFNARDYSVWKRELEREVKYGDQVFHDDKLIGSTNGVSCAMCHPHAANTHPETYPKFQIQLRRVALLRDMINWCIENPSRGKKLDADDPKMRALEAYIMAQRKGVPMEYGKH
ncbi:MAG: cytochrome C [Acidobacteria bacterium]|nr:cytochrome C [Acidobacteriota bacterium]